jgi:stress-induced-phosphoprotein 1
MQDPEIQNILRDPMVNAALEDMQRDAGAMRRVMADPTMAGKIQKLIAAGIVGMR